MRRRAAFDLIAGLVDPGRLLVVPRVFIDLCGGRIDDALVLSQLLYWRNRMDGEWLAKSADDWRAEIGISRHCLNGAVGRLRELGVVETTLRKFDGAPTLHYRLDEERLAELVLDACNQRHDEPCAAPEPDPEPVQIEQEEPKPARRSSKQVHDDETDPVHEVLRSADAIVPIVNWGKEGAAAKRLLAAGFSPEEIAATYRRWVEMRRERGGDAYGYSLASYSASAGAMIADRRAGRQTGSRRRSDMTLEELAERNAQWLEEEPP